MNRLGKVLHLSNSGRLILRTRLKVRAETTVLSDEMRTVGMVFDVFGPVKNPYVSVKPATSDPERYVGRFLYVSGT